MPEWLLHQSCLQAMAAKRVAAKAQASAAHPPPGVPRPLAHGAVEQARCCSHLHTLAPCYAPTAPSPHAHCARALQAAAALAMQLQQRLAAKHLAKPATGRPAWGGGGGSIKERAASPSPLSRPPPSAAAAAAAAALASQASSPQGRGRSSSAPTAKVPKAGPPEEQVRAPAPRQHCQGGHCPYTSLYVTCMMSCIAVF